MIRPLFIIGNKRSGTSQLVRVLNLHPHIFVSHESDIAWILYQFHQCREFQAHPWDSDRGMRITLKSSGHCLRHEASVWENFLSVQLAVMAKGNPWLSPQNKDDLRWVGDKKPLQHTDPDLLKFILEHFPEARFLHIVRHPFDVVASSNEFNQTVNGDFWLGLSPEKKIERWAFHEQTVLRLRQTMPNRVHSLRYEDFCQDTEKALSSVFDFLEVKPDADALMEAARQTRLKARVSPAVPCSAAVADIARAYGYELERRTGWFDRFKASVAS